MNFGIELRRGQFEIALDGKAIGTIDNKETVEVSIDPGQHTLRIRHGRYSSRDRAFDVADGEVAEFRCHGVRYWPVWLASFAKSDLAIVLSSE